MLQNLNLLWKSKHFPPQTYVTVLSTYITLQNINPVPFLCLSYDNLNDSCNTPAYDTWAVFLCADGPGELHPAGLLPTGREFAADAPRPVLGPGCLPKG